jgi:hypothetical protein
MMQTSSFQRNILNNKVGIYGSSVAASMQNFTLKINLISANGKIPYQFWVLSFVSTALFWNGRDGRTHQIL